jgi:DNA-binding response OmpR family regulator
MTTPDGRKMVLILDDSAVTLDLLRLALERAGFAVTTALNLASFERSAALAPDLILIDVQMPEAYGDDVASTLRGARKVRVPIFLISNLEETELRRRTAEADVDGWISKNAGVEEVVRRVTEILP